MVLSCTSMHSRGRLMRHRGLGKPVLQHRSVSRVRHHRCSDAARCRAAASNSSSSRQDSNLSGAPVLVVPAFYLDAQVFKPLVVELRRLGFNAALPEIRWYNWLPTLGGRSMRPILDRVDYTLTALLEGYQVTEEGRWEVPLPRRATRQDWLTEYRDASKGAQPPLQLTGRWEAGGRQKAALVASSAAGWISRIFLGSGPEYGGAVYHGADRVHTLVTLGTPHVSAEPVTRRNIDFVNQSFPGAHMPGVRYVAVGSKTVQGKAYLGGRAPDFTWQSYSICCGKGNVWGDGITPLECALALPGAELIELEGAAHTPLDERDGKARWYGSGEYLEKWVHFLSPKAVAGDVV